MPKKDARVDAYIAKAADFAKPILRHLRNLVHTACPEVEETIKWRFPTFIYKGMLCGMAAFKEHCTFGFWKHALIFGEQENSADDGMGQFGKLTSVSQLPKDKVLLGHIKTAMRLNEEGIKVALPKPKARKELTVPDDLLAALKKNKAAGATFANFSYSHRKEYVEWLTEAKREETRQQRLATTIAWLAKGKPRNWKYANC
jgi:uncharacterized protein YdeI (YjbR/CyaY-like superfamily)